MIFSCYILDTLCLLQRKIVLFYRQSQCFPNEVEENIAIQGKRFAKVAVIKSFVKKLIITKSERFYRVI